MCGILCEICFLGKSGLNKDIIQRVKNRGPDYDNITYIHTDKDVSIFFFGAVLWMQGCQLAPQPVESISGVLLHNGDIYDTVWNKNFSDTQHIMNTFHNINLVGDPKHREENMIKAFKSLKGPFSIVYYDKAKNDLYFARDRIGRSSLLFHKSHESIIISSVLGRNYKCVEIPATSIHILNLNTSTVKLFSWNEEQMQEFDLEVWFDNIQYHQNVPDEEFLVDDDTIQDLSDKDNVIDTIDKIAHECKERSDVFNMLLDCTIINETVKKLIYLLEKSMEMRLDRQPNKCKDCLTNNSVLCSHCTVGILFSGGLDCTILAFIADKFIPKNQPIDLINVAFKKDKCSTFDVPDRLTGRRSLIELQMLCPSRDWNFKEVNVPKEEFDELQRTYIADLIYPRQTILDESLGTALWFAARCKSENLSSPCRILLLGSGADELFGGYSRHRNAFKYHSWPGLSKELKLDWKRIAFRNLARDNRVICDNGRQPRLPYLDEDFTNYVLQLQPWLRCYPSDNLGVGLGDKLMLRLVAYELGLHQVATFPKRALQFGSRIANKKEKGSDLSKHFL